MLIVVPIGLYLFFYQRSRIEAATIRNFRALDAAADRVDQVLLHLSTVVNSSSFGVSPTMLDEVTERLKGNQQACTSDSGFRRGVWSRPGYPLHLLRSRRTTAAQRLEHRYWLAARTLFESNQRNGGATEDLWNELHCLIDTHRKFAGPDETVGVTVASLPRAALRPSAPACDDWTATSRCIRLRELLEAEPCPQSAGSPRLSVGRDGIEATVSDCRRLEERYAKLDTALDSFHGAGAVIRAIDLFGIRSAANLDELMNEATGYLSRFFDNHLIADADGLILFEAEASDSGTEGDESQVETPGFASYVDISEFLRAESQGSDGSGLAEAGDGTNRRGSASAPSFRGRSFVRIVGDEHIDLRVFVHPFILNTVAVSGLAQGDLQADQASSNAATRPARPTFYLVGVVDDREFRSAAIRMRLGRVTNATLLLLAVLTLTPLLWFWTADDRAVVGRLALFGVCTLPLVGVVLFTVLACGVVTNRMDEHALDGAMEHVSSRIADLFDRELSDEIRRLRLAFPRLLARAASEESAPPRLPTVVRSGGRILTGLERAFYCDDAHRNLNYDPARPEAWSATLLDDDGRQRVCLSEPRRGRPARTPALDLQFRDYFKRPKEGVLWGLPLPARLPPVGCRVDVVQDEESLIPCLVDGLRDPSRPLFDMVGEPGGAAARYFLERIDSVVGGRVATILAVNTGRTATPVATAAVSLNALDRAVPPRHVDFAVVDRETGRTLFHSDDDLAMTTNFVEDTGRDPALRSVLRSGARDTIDLVYTGVPVRAHVRPLRPGMPWTLVVYRGHELEDRAAGLTATLSIFSTFLSLVLIASLAGLVLLVARWCKPETLAGVPATLGRVMAVGSRLLWPPVVAVTLLLLLCSPWFSGNAWTQGGGWRILPFLAVSSIVAVAALVVRCAFGASTTRGGGGARDPGTIGRVAGLAALVVALAVAPSVLWFGHHRAILGIGLNHYLVDETLDAVGRAREEYRVDMLARHGAAAAPAGDRMRRRWREEPEADPVEGWMSRSLRSLLASSELANQLMLYRILPAASADHVTSLHGVFARTFGYDIGPSPGPLSTPDFGRFLVAAMGFLLFLSLIAGHGYSVCAACTVVGGRRHGLIRLPDARRLRHPADQPLRAIVVHRNQHCREDFAQELAEDLDVRRHKPRVERPAGGLRPVVSWTPVVDSAGDKTLYVFDDLREVLNDDAEGRALLDELECKVNTDAHVLIGSRVVPDYRYSDRFGPSDRWFDRGHSDGEDRRQKWMGLVREFGSYSLDSSSVRCVENSFQAKAGNPPSSAPDDIWRAMSDEAVANPELLRVAAYLANGPRRHGDTPSSVVTRFRKCGASGLHQVWAESTHDERLALYALARGGVVDSRRTAALSSLVNRGIVREDRGTGVLGLHSAAFREFIEHDIDHGEIDDWRKEGGGGVWRLIWPPVAIGGALGLAFLAMANPEVRATLLAALVGLLPVVLAALGGGQGAGSAGTATGN